jgi:hypothetical protein
MDKQARLAWIKQRHEASQDAVGELPISKREIRETVEELDSFREYARDRKTNSEVLTSDEA